jgi:nitrate reductase NapAB chaperone NapD
MFVSGLIVDTLASKLEQVKYELMKLDCVEINSILDDSKLVVVVESEDVESEALLSKKIVDIDGVLGIKLAYHHFGDEEKE